MVLLVHQQCKALSVKHGLHAETDSLMSSVTPGQYMHIHAHSKVLLKPR